MTIPQITRADLAGLDCGLCGYPTCDELAEQLPMHPELAKRCIHLANASAATVAGDLRPAAPPAAPLAFVPAARSLTSTGAAPALPVLPSCATGPRGCAGATAAPAFGRWTDSLGRDFDFVLRHFPEEPGPREIILPHNPMLTREMEIRVGDVLIGRPLGMSCGCPITHCGVVTAVEPRTGVITWCVTGPLRPRAEGFKDLGYYIAEAYEGLIKEARCDIRIGARYFFQPEMCMLQWRHSGLVNFVNRTAEGLQVRVEGLWIG